MRHVVPGTGWCLNSPIYVHQSQPWKTRETQNGLKWNDISHFTMLYSNNLSFFYLVILLFCNCTPNHLGKKNAGSMLMSITRLKDLHLPMREKSPPRLVTCSLSGADGAPEKRRIFRAVLGTWTKLQSCIKLWISATKARRFTQQCDQHLHQHRI